MTITALPTPPTRSDPVNFAERADDFLAALPVFVTELNSAAVEVDADKTAAEAAAVDALASKNSAQDSAIAAELSAAASASSAGAALWVSGTTYAVGAVVYSPINGLIYRRLIAGAGTTDPSNDTTNWLQVSVGFPIVEVVTSTTVSAIRFRHYVLTATGQTTVTLPLSPRKDDTIFLSFQNDRVDNIINTNGQNFQGIAGNVDVDARNLTLQLVYVDTTRGWRIV